MLLCLAGCEQPARPIFTEMKPPVEWPLPPDTPRIRYVGQLAGEASLNAPVRGMEALRAALSGPKPKVAFSTPTAVAVLGERVFVADTQSRAVFILNLEDRSFGAIHQAAGKNLAWPLDVTIWNGEVAVADAERGAVFMFDPVAKYTRSIGEGKLKRPSSVAVDAPANELLVADSGAHDIKVFGADGSLRRTFGSRGESSGQFNYPVGIAFHPRVGLTVCDSMNFRVQVLSSDGAPRAVFGRKGDAAGDFSLPRDAAVDSEGHLYILDNQFENVQIFNPDGQLLMAFGHEGSSPGELYLPSGITIDDRDRIWIADTYNRRVQVFQYLAEGRQ